MLDTARLRTVVDDAFGALGRIDVIFSNAGRGAFGAAEELSDAAIDEQIALNMTAPIHLLRAALPHLRAQGVGIPMVEPGSVRTGFGAALSIADALPVYAGTPVGRTRRYVSGGNVTGAAPGDPAKVAAAIIDSAAHSPAPRRIALGSDAFAALRGALTGRLTELDAGRELALSTDFTLENR